MNLIAWMNKNNIDVAFVIALIGILLSLILQYSWVISIIACLFLKEDEIQ